MIRAPHALPHPTRTATRAAVRALSRRAALRYCAGPRVEDAITVAERAAARGARATIGPWTAPDVSAEEACDRHLDAIRAVRNARLDAVVSVKTGALDQRRDLVDLVVATALRDGIELCFDAHDWAGATWTLAASRRAVAQGHPAVGVALPSRWPRSATDVAECAADGRAVRLVKGQWAPEDGRALPPAAGMLRLADLVRDHPRPVRVASHDAALVAAVLDRLRGTSTVVEVELLLGLPMRRPTEVARASGVPVRLYVPFGSADVPYEPGDARHDPAIALRLLRDAARAEPHE